MFYNHDYLTSKKAGLRIVWLASTLGSASRKLTKRDFVTVDVAKTCNSVAHPTQPLALRTSGQLMYGVTRVYTKQADYLLGDVQAHRDTIHRIVAEGGHPTKQIGGLVVVGRGDTSTIDMPGRGRPNNDSITLPMRFDFFANHSNIDMQWMTNEIVGESDTFMASQVSVLDSSQISRTGSVEFGVGVQSSSPRQRTDKYTMDPSEIRRAPSTSSPLPDLALFNLDELMPEILEGEGVDLGLDTNLDGDLPPLDDIGFDVQPDWQDGAAPMDKQDEILLSPSRRKRSASVESQNTPPIVHVPNPKRTRFALADSSMEISNESVLSWRDNYVSQMARLRLEEADKELLRRGRQGAKILPFAPGLEISFAPSLISLWEESVNASMESKKALAEVANIVIEDPGVGRHAADVIATQQGVLFQDDYDMPQWEDPNLPSVGGIRTSSPQYGSEVARGSQSSQKHTTLPWNQPTNLRDLGDTTMGGDTTSFQTTRSFSVETPVGLRRQSSRQNSIGVASIGQEAMEEDMPLAFARQSFPANSQDVADKEMTNFFSYANRVRAQVPLEQPLFFSDLAPIADSTPYIAASAFYHTLALATAKMLRVEQQSAYAEIKIELVNV